MFNGRKILLPNGDKIEIKETGLLTIPKTTISQQVNILPKLSSASLLSVGKFTDAGCEAHFTKNEAIILKDNKPILKGIRNKRDGLYDIAIPAIIQDNTLNMDQSETPKLNVIIQVDKNKAELAQFLHATLFSPTVRTLQKAILNNHFLSWPGIEKVQFDKLVENSIPMAMGHLHQERRNLRSTKTEEDKQMQDEIECFFPQQEKEKVNMTFSILQPYAPKSKAYGDLTGQFPYKSSNGNRYIYVLYDYDSNAILVHPIPNRQAQTISCAWTTLTERLMKNGHRYENFILDNEISSDLKQAFKKYEIEYQCVPPKIHRRNAAERAIQTFKNHFLAGLATCDDQFPIQEWDKLLPQAEITLNLLRRARQNSMLSAYAYLFGAYNFNKHPMVPPGTKAVVHKKPADRSSWAYHGMTGWYVGPTLEHYRCVKVYLPKTHATVIADTVKFIPSQVPFPYTDNDTFLKQTIGDLLALLKNKKSKMNVPKIMFGDEIQNSIQEIATILKQNKLQGMQNSAKETRVVSRPQQNVATQPRAVITKIKIPALPSMETFKNAWEQANRKEIVNHIFENDKKLTIDKLLEGPTKNTWLKSLDNELGRLSDGFNHIKGTNTIAFIYKHQVPENKKVTYANMVCDYRPLKEEKYRVRLTVGGDKLVCEFDVASPAASILEAKVLINSVISDANKGARFLTLDIKDFFLCSHLKDPEYMRIKAKYFSKEFRDKYMLHKKIHADGYVYCIIQRGMYGLKQAAILAYKQLIQNLDKFGYEPIEGTTGMWHHRTRRTKFALCVDDFGVKYFTKEDAIHLVDALKTNYVITEDWTGSNYCGFKIKWDYQKRFVDISMPNYIQSALQKYDHKKPKKPEYAPFRYNRPIYGRNHQIIEAEQPLDILPKKQITTVQSKIGTCLYYARGVDPTILTALNELATEQACPTEKTEKDLVKLFDYLSTYPNAVIRYVAGPMQLRVESDASYLVLKGAKSRVAGHFYLQPHKNYFNTTPQNGPVHTECSTLKNVVCSAAEAECGGLFVNCQKAIEIRRLLEALGHPQEPTEVKTDNSTAASFVHDTMRMKRAKTWDMRWNWLRQKQQRLIFKILWEKGARNKADYFTKHHPPNHHRERRYDYLLKGT